MEVSGLKSIFGDDDLVKKDGKISVSDAISGMELIGIYFSAHWCGPCRQFTPKLAEIYKSWKADGKKIEIIFGSSDRDAKNWSEYYAEMPWLAFPFGDKRKDVLEQKYNVNGIPWLVILDKNGKLVQNEADTAISASGAAAINEWLG